MPKKGLVEKRPCGKKDLWKKDLVEKRPSKYLDIGKKALWNKFFGYDFILHITQYFLSRYFLSVPHYKGVLNV